MEHPRMEWLLGRLHARRRPIMTFGMVCCTALTMLVEPARAQDPATPRTVATDDAARARTAAAEARLDEVVSLTIDRVPLRQAIDTLAATANVTVLYQTAVVLSASRPVTLHAVRMRLRDAFSRVLEGTALELVSLPGGQFSIIPAHDGSLAAGGINGTVTDAKTKRSVEGARLVLDDSGKVVQTDASGHYRFLGVSAGPHRLAVRAVGFARQARLVNVVDDQTVTVNFALASNINTLDQVVVTATGEQRIRELGHVVSQINADSLVKEAPVSDIGELLQSRVPGLQVLTGSGGIAGGPISLRLRGQSSLSLSSEPIVIVDGVRYKSNNLVPGYTGQEAPEQRGFNAQEPASPLNDLNVNDIESVEIVKGPSASTLYGPDGVNGVIVITTKHGKGGPTQWNWYAHPLFNTVPTEQRLNQTTYHVWAHDPYDPTETPISYACTLEDQYRYNACVIDSVTVAPSILQQPDVTTLGPTRPSWEYGLNLNGGSPALRYYFSGNYLNQIGNVQVPIIVQNLLKQQLGVSSLSDAVRNPSTLQNIGTHGSVSATPSPTIDLNATVDYHQTKQNVFLPSVALNTYSPFSLPPGATGQLGDSLTDQYVLENLYSVQLALQSQQAEKQRLSASLQGTIRPTTWLSASALAGLDIGDGTEHDLQPGSGQNNDGNAVDERRTDLGRTMTLNATASNRISHVSFRSSVGVNYIYARSDGLNVLAGGIASGTSSVATGSYYSLKPLWDESVSLGTYGQEVVGLGDQLFLDLGLRVDGSTRFGDAYHPTALPKVGLSWIASDAPFLQGRLPGVSDLRFRTSFGTSTRYPTSVMKVGNITSLQVYVADQPQTAFTLAFLANPDLRPETGREFEYGADATLFSRLQVGLTWWSRTTHDELFDAQLPNGLPPQWRNLASVSQSGFEATATLPVIDARSVQADLQFTFSHHTSKVLNVGQNPASTATTKLVAGYPIDAIFGTPIISVADTVGGFQDKIYESGEEVVGPSTYYGVFEPPTSMTLTPQLGLLNGHLRLSAVFDRETGFVAENPLAANCVRSLTCKAAYDPSTPILLQAQLYNSYGDNPSFLESGDFTRWRELSLTMDVPSRFLRLDFLHLSFSRASISLQGRNLALWTRFSGSDPESSSASGEYGPAYGGIPQTRSWGFRFDLTP